MVESDQRHITRNSLFVLATIRLAGNRKEHRVKIRNLSSGGLMAEASLRVAPGMALEIELRNIGWVAGTVAWVQDNRFGVAFTEEIDTKAARAHPDQPADWETHYAHKATAASVREMNIARLRQSNFRKI